MGIENLKKKLLCLLFFSIFLMSKCLYAPLEPTADAKKTQTKKDTVDENGKEGIFLKLIKKIAYAGLKKLTEKERTIKFSDIPIWDKLPLVPKFIKDYYGSLVLYTPKVEETKDGFFISAATSTHGKKVEIKLKIKKLKEGNSYTVYVQLPKEWKFSDAFPIPPKLDLIAIKDGAFVITDQDQTDPDWGKLVKGINIVGSLKYEGVFAYVNKMFGGIPEKLIPKIRGSLAIPKGIGSQLELEIPFGMTVIPDVIALSPMRVFVRIDEDVTGAPVPSVAIKGGLRIRIPSFMRLDKKDLLSSLSHARDKGLGVTIIAEENEDIQMFLKAVREDVNQHLTAALISKFLLRKPTVKGNTITEIREEIENKIIKKTISDIGKVREKIYPSWVKLPIDFSALIKVGATKAELVAESTGKLYNIFFIKGLNAADWKIGLIWDYALSGELSATIIGAPLAFLPVGGTFAGKLEFDKSWLQLETKGALSGVTGIGELAWRGKGSLFLRNFVDFYLRWAPLLGLFIPTGPKAPKLKSEDIHKFINKFVPDWKLENQNLRQQVKYHQLLSRRVMYC